MGSSFGHQSESLKHLKTAVPVAILSAGCCWSLTGTWLSPRNSSCDQGHQTVELSVAAGGARQNAHDCRPPCFPRPGMASHKQMQMQMQTNRAEAPLMRSCSQRFVLIGPLDPLDPPCLLGPGVESQMRATRSGHGSAEASSVVPSCLWHFVW